MTDINRKKPLIIGVAGGSGSGKTTLSHALESRLGSDKSLLFQLDSYYRDLSHMPSGKRADVNFDHPDAIDLKLFATHLIHLKENKSVRKPVYDFNTHTRLNSTEDIAPKDVIIAEGILLFSVKAIRECVDYCIYIDIGTDIRFKRRVDRDVKERGRSVASVKKQYYGTVESMYKEYVEPSKRYVDIILTDGNISDWVDKIISELSAKSLA